MDIIQFTSNQTKQILTNHYRRTTGIKHTQHESRVIIGAIKTLIRAIIAQNNKTIKGRLPDSQSVFMTPISD